MDCEQALRLISAQLDREITPDESSRLNSHLHECTACASALDALQVQDAELRRAYEHCWPWGGIVAERTIARLRAVAMPRSTPVDAKADRRHRYFRWTLAAAILVGVGFGLYRLAPRTGMVSGVPAGGDDLGLSVGELDYLTPRRLAPGDSRPPLAVGAERHTGANERLRVALPDGSYVYLNQNTRVRLDGDRRLLVEAGEVFVEVAPRPASGGRRSPGADSTFVVRTAQREVTALGTKFAVKVEPAGTSVVVTQGKVEVSGVSGVLSAGQQLRADVDRPDPAPRASVVLDWLREPIAAAESPLVPRSQHTGGSLIAVDPYGQEARLSLRNYRVDVHIEDGFARTTIDQTYFNHNGWRMEGTFYFPLPPDASLSRLAMYVADGKECNLMEGGMAERDYARNVFEQIVTRQKDPALLEWLDGSTFKMRVFPLEGRQEKRIILSYVQRLDSLYGRLGYRFPGGHNLPLVNKWSANIRVKNGADLAWSCAGYPLDKQTDGSDLVLTTSASNVKPDRDLTVELIGSGTRQSAGAAEPAIPTSGDFGYFTSAVHEGARYLMVRYRPNLASPRQVQRRDWVLLFESSGDRDPLLARAQIEIIRTLLNNAGHEDTFAIVQAGTRVRVLEAKQVTPENVKAGLEFLEKAHLIGALDLATALREAVKQTEGAPNPTIVHVGSGIAALGLRNENDLSKRVPDQVPYVGVGVGKRWSRSFMKATAERTGGAFTQINPDESIGWRAFELFSLLNTPRLMNVKVVDDMERVKFLTFNSMVAQGEEVCAIGRIEGTGGLTSPARPENITIDGTFEGKPFRVSLPVADIKDKADYLPRAWAKLEIDRLVAGDKEHNKAAIIDLSKKMYVMSPFTSLLVLENEQMYEQFKVDRGRKDHWAMYACPAKIPTVYEPDPAQGIDVRNAPKNAEPPSQKPAVEQVLSTIQVRMPPRLFSNSSQQALTAIQLARGAWGVANLTTSEEIGSDPDLPTNYNIDRIEEVSVPGPINANWPVGIRTGSGPMAPVMGMPGMGGLGGRFHQGFAMAGWQWTGGQFGNLGGQFGLQGGVPPGNWFAPPGFGSQAGPLAFWDMGGGEGEMRRMSRGDIDARLLLMVDSSASMRLADGEGLYGEVLRKTLELRDLRQTRVATLSLSVRDVEAKLRKVAEDKERADTIAGRLLSGFTMTVPTYQRPTFSGDQRIFHDVMAYAPGMNTRRADILAVVDAEARPDPKTAPGTIDPAAARLIDQVRSAGWQSIGIPATARQPAFTVIFDGTGRFAYNRVTANGLRERVYCDGTTLWHLYPELCVGARRSVSRFHRAELTDLVPWALPPVQDLARGCNLTLHGADTVRITPRDVDDKKPHLAVELVFVEGRLAERRAIEMPSSKMLYRETYSAGGQVQFAGGDGKVVSDIDLGVEPAEAAPSTPDTKSCVVLSLPFRTQDHVYRKYALHDKAWPFRDAKLSDEAALEVFAAWLPQNSWQAFHFYRDGLPAQSDARKLGFAVLLIAAGIDLQSARSNGRHLVDGSDNRPLAHYLRVVGDVASRQAKPVGNLGGPAAGFLQRLAAFRDLSMHWQQGAPDLKKELPAVVDFVQANKNTGRGWIVLSLASERAAGDPETRAELAKLFPLFNDLPGIGYAARYEHARLAAPDQARAAFLDLYRKTLDAGRLPLIDDTFRKAVQLDGTDASAWYDLIRQTARSLIAKEQRLAVVTLAGQCAVFGDVVVADELAYLALKGVPASEKLATTLAVIEFHIRNNQHKQAEALLDTLLKDAPLSEDANLWFLAAALAGMQKPTMRSVLLYDKALEIAYRKLPEVINVQQVRSEYGQLLASYQQILAAMSYVGMEPPKELVGRVVRAADRWRSLDTDPTQACQAAAQLLKQLGAADLAWDYLTTPTALKPNEAGAQLQLAQSLLAESSYDLADKAFVAAFEAESTNPEILMQRAQALQAAGKGAEARKVYRQIADGQWQPRFQWVQQQARHQVGSR